MQRKTIEEIKKIRKFHNQPVSESDRCFYPNDEYKMLLFEQWKAADGIVRRLEEIREKNEPKLPDEEWNEAFCMAIQALPEAQQFEKDCWWDYTYRGNAE